MVTIPETGFLRLAQILGDKKSNPQIPAVIPVCKSTWWQGVKSGKFPKPIKLGPRVTVWKADEIRQLVEKECFGYEAKVIKKCKKKS